MTKSRPSKRSRQRPGGQTRGARRGPAMPGQPTAPTARQTRPPTTLPTIWTAAQLAPLVNAYTITAGPPRTITVPHASPLAGLQDLTVSGMLLNRQRVQLDVRTNTRTTQVTDGGGYTKQEKDGDLHFCLGAAPGEPHIAGELQNAAAWISTFNAARGQDIAVSGFFRCLFEHPGFQAPDDAHIFEIHPVRAVNFSGSLQAFNVDIPVQTEIHTWTSPNDLNRQDGRITVTYDKATDTLHFRDMDGRDENYIKIGSGTVSNVQISATPPAPSRFTLTSQEVGHPIDVLALHGTTAERQLIQLKTSQIHLIALRNIDLPQALTGRYVINLLAIDVQAL